MPPPSWLNVKRPFLTGLPFFVVCVFRFPLPPFPVPGGWTTLALWESSDQVGERAGTPMEREKGSIASRLLHCGLLPVIGRQPSHILCTHCPSGNSKGNGLTQVSRFANSRNPSHIRLPS